MTAEPSSRPPVVEQVRHSYATKEDIRNPGWSDAVCRGQFARCTVADLLHWCHEQELDPAAVEVVGGGGITYHRRETAEERDLRLASVARADARHEQWERETYERLREKFRDAAWEIEAGDR